VVGFGGYPSVPPIIAARTLPRARRPVTALHEQNAVLGRANRLLSRGADLLALSVAETAHVPSGAKAVVVGNPVRPALAALAGQAYAPPAEDGAIRLLVLGGSLGARIFADIVPAAVAALPEALRARLVVTQQTRAEDLPRVETAYRQAGVPADLSPFFGDIATRLAMAHLVIARAGASTVAELACAARPSILVPLPHAIDNHQSANARSLAAVGAAWVMPQSAFTADALARQFAAMADNPPVLARAAAAAAKEAHPEAARRLADLVQSLMRATAPMESR
jgi:UDP-N-acetylglucosamine--N-acetylmuramyl-(pentapeptide) pyrophosphoryl-undecaprenol N-acetylglucosamine transferase